jgi:hypothetical protein
VRFSGSVVRKPIATGSKSEREAVVLLTDSGQFVLRRHGGNPFNDPELNKLVGKTIKCSGELTGHTILMSEWEEAGST